MIQEFYINTGRLLEHTRFPQQEQKLAEQIENRLRKARSLAPDETVGQFYTPIQQASQLVEYGRHMSESLQNICQIADDTSRKIGTMISDTTAAANR